MSRYNVGETFESYNWMISINVVGHMGYLTCEHFFPDSSIVRQMSDKLDVEEIGSWETDLDTVLIPACEVIFSF